MGLILLYISTLLTTWNFAPEQEWNSKPAADDAAWQVVTVPHDWAISGDFDRNNDLQVTTVVQNGETKPSAKTGRSGGLPWIGRAWYQTSFDATPTRDKVYYLLFDGAMSQPMVWVNDELAGEWQYGYTGFYLDITPYVVNGKNDISVRLENQEESSRWYPGAGLYRNVHLIETSKTHIPIWGIRTTTPYISDSLCTVEVDVELYNALNGTEVTTEILAPYVRRGGGTMWRVVASIQGQKGVAVIHDPKLWSPERPNLYKTRTYVRVKGELVDERETTLGFRKIEFVPGIGFMLNGKVRKFQGVCLHHDLGPLGAAVHEDAIRHQLTLLKDMGVDAIRTSHNPPAPELVKLCEEMGFMMMVESFDVWTHNKCRNGYASLFYKWAETDITNMVMRYRNSPAVVMWSVGNEVWDQTFTNGYLTARYLQNIVHHLDATRPVTCGMDQVLSVLDNGFAAEFDIPGLNYRTMRYEEAYNKLPQKLILGSETASTVSSRGTYHLPAIMGPDILHKDNQSSGYDIEYCAWSGLPDQDFQLQDDYHWTIGQFIWTGVDYLGEPSPYDTDAWPSHSSYFGAIDLASLPKDRFYLYRSQWNKQDPTLHVLPHWNWKSGIVPVYVYTSYPSAEIFVNGKSYGRLHFATAEEAERIRQGEKIDGVSEMPALADFEVPVWGSAPRPDLLPRYRLMWHNVRYEKGELKVVAYNADGSVAQEKIIRTAGKPDHLNVVWANEHEKAREMKYLTVSVVDKDGNLCPEASNLITAHLKSGHFYGAANGDATCLDKMTEPRMHAFKGMATFIVSKDADVDFTFK